MLSWMAGKISRIQKSQAAQYTSPTPAIQHPSQGWPQIIPHTSGDCIAACSCGQVVQCWSDERYRVLELGFAVTAFFGMKTSVGSLNRALNFRTCSMVRFRCPARNIETALSEPN